MEEAAHDVVAAMLSLFNMWDGGFGSHKLLKQTAFW
jgi:hypothetical protein